MTATEYIQLVNEDDQPVGIMEKLSAHRAALLHRAVSVLLFNSAGELLLQQRARGKYHSGGLWTNTCCTHPRPEEDPLTAARRRLEEEMGICCDPEYRFKFIYKAVLDQGLAEHELDHVFFAFSDQVPAPDPGEVAAWRYLSLPALKQELAERPESFSAWLPLIVEQMKIENYVYPF